MALRFYERKPIVVGGIYESTSKRSVRTSGGGGSSYISGMRGGGDLLNLLPFGVNRLFRSMSSSAGKITFSNETTTAHKGTIYYACNSDVLTEENAVYYLLDVSVNEDYQAGSGDYDSGTGEGTGGGNTYYNWTSTIKKYRTTISHGSGSTIQAEEGAYPANGRQGDYWYIMGGTVNSAPVISGDATALGVITGDRSIRFRVSDSESSTVTVEVTIDGVRAQGSPFMATVGQDYSIPIKYSSLSLGSHNAVVKATDSGGLSSSRTWTFSRANSNPIVSGIDEDLGNQNSGFDVSFSVDDMDLQDVLDVRVYLNDVVVKTFSNVARKHVYSVSISDGQVMALALGEINTVKIEVFDNAGGSAFRYKYFKRSNTAPVISGEDRDLGVVSDIPSISFSATDNEGDALVYSVLLNNKVIFEKKALVAGVETSVAIPLLEFVQLDNISVNTVVVRVEDIHKAISIRKFTFKRLVDNCWHLFKRETDARATKVYCYVNAILPTGAALSVKACNNVFDTNPTWEDVTASVLSKALFNFTNSTKTAAKWGVGLKVQIDPGTATDPCWIVGYGGGYE